MKRLLLFACILAGAFCQSALAASWRPIRYPRRSSYLPPRARKFAPAKQEFIQIRLENAEPRQTTSGFNEKNYENANYRIFEVHNHYLPPPQQRESFVPAITPSSVHSTNQQNTYSTSSGPTNEQQFSLASVQQSQFNTGYQYQSQQQSNFKAPDYIPPVPAAPPAYQPQFPVESTPTKDYLPPYQINQSHNQAFSGATPGFAEQQSVPLESGSSYLPPSNQRYNQVTQPTQLQVPQYNQQNSIAANQQYSAGNSISINGPAYLPPKPNVIDKPTGQLDATGLLPPVEEAKNYQQLPFQTQNQYQQDLQAPTALQPPVANAAFKGADYIPPQQSYATVSAQSTPFKSPEYLPPQQNYQSAGASFQSAQFKGPEYLPPQQNYQSAGDSFQSAQLKGPEYLPPNQNYAPISAETQSATGSVQSAPFKGPEYLPPQQNYQSTPVSSQPGPFRGPEYLPPSIKGSDYLPPHQNHAGSFQSFQSNTAPMQSAALKGPEYLPPQQNYATTFVENQNSLGGTEYLPPLESNAANSLSSSGFTQSGLFQAAGFSPQNNENIVAVQQQSSSQGSARQLKITPPSTILPPGFDFIKPENSEAAIKELHTLPAEEPAQSFQQLNADNFPPPIGAALSEGNSPFPALIANQQQSYVSNAGSNYGNSITSPQNQPLLTYGLPAQMAAISKDFNRYGTTYQQTVNSGNAGNLVPAAFYGARVAASPSGKLRTVQFINQAAVKTLRVLESADQPGVKNIKILGHTQVQPQGQHRIVNVISDRGHNAQQVQTLKIFDEDVGATANSAAVNSGYLPPAAKT